MFLRQCLTVFQAGLEPFVYLKITSSDDLELHLRAWITDVLKPSLCSAGVLFTLARQALYPLSEAPSPELHVDGKTSKFAQTAGHRGPNTQSLIGSMIFSFDRQLGIPWSSVPQILMKLTGEFWG